MRASEWKIGPESVRMLELGHPWIIADAYTKRWPAGQAGQVIELADGQGKFLATALLDPQERIVARVLSRERIRLERARLGQRLHLRRHRREQADQGIPIVHHPGIMTRPERDVDDRLPTEAQRGVLRR